MEYLTPHTPLGYAAYLGSVRLVRKLIQLGADPNGRDSQSLLPIIRAAQYEKVHAIRCLLQNNAGFQLLLINYLSFRPIFS